MRPEEAQEPSWGAAKAGALSMLLCHAAHFVLEALVQLRDLQDHGQRRQNERRLVGQASTGQELSSRVQRESLSRRAGL